ncbi:MAG: ATP-binding cassette domain-containing protein [Rhodopseudomonas sp.]|nr:ATP-binding cassette domain-containing protein [Rhodopseudomonas sp.]
MPPLAVHCHSLTKTYGSGEAAVPALRGVNLDVARGELLMLVGPSGCGKTSLISIIATLADPDSGTCEVLGQDVAQLDALGRARFRNQAVGFVFQVFNLLPTLTVVENIAVPMLIAGRSRKYAELRAADLAERVGLSERRDAPSRELSGGQQQRVAIARALACEPRLLICDEPTSSLDHETGQSMMELLQREAKVPDRAVIVVTHDPRIFGFADRIARMDDGRIVSAEEMSVNA